MERIVTFNKVGYDPFIDFIKAYAIICVLLGHTFLYLDETGYCLWYGMQVPLFVLVQVFHAFKKEKAPLSLRKIFARILLPYAIVQFLLLIVLLLESCSDYKSLIVNTLIEGGRGPGSYYPWVYIQLAIILYFIKPYINVVSKGRKLFIAFAVCESFEIISSLIDLPEVLHRLLAIRYLFLIYLGWIWVNKGIVINRKTIFLSLLSLLSVIYFEYFYVPTEPWFYDTAWRTHRWPCYFYVSTLLSYILYLIYSRIKHIRVVDKSIKILARCSYEIFLVQMAVIVLCPSLDFIGNAHAQLTFRMILVWTLSIVGGYYFNITYNNFYNKFVINGKL